jgi:hypothetical protein
VSFDDNRGQYYLGSTTPAPPATATELAIIGSPASGTFGQTVSVTARLAAGTVGIPDKPVILQIGGAAAIGLTDSNGNVTLPLSLNSTPGATSITVSFGGDATHLASSAQKSFTIGKAPTALTAISPFVTVTDDDRVGTLTTLTATLGSTTQPLINRTVTVTVTGPASETLSLITDYLGRVRLPPDLPAGGYTVTASFAGDETYEPATASGSVTVAPLAFLAPVDAAPTVNVLKAGATVPIKFSLGGNHGLNVLDGTPKAVSYDCVSGAIQDPIEVTASGNSGLTFNASTGIYQYSWKTPRAPRGCYRFELEFDDGSLHVALFELR